MKNTLFLILFSLSISAQQYNGLFNFTYSEKGSPYNETGTTESLILEVNDLESNFLYVNYLSQGLGNNDLGLDRGKIGSQQIVYFQKAGNKLLLIQPNLKFRATTKNQLEKASVEQAFGKSVLFGFPILGKTEKGYEIDLTPFLMQDVFNVAGQLQKSKQGNYSIDKQRSALNFERTKAFPKNVEFETLITLQGKPTGTKLKSVVPNTHYVTTYQHHSFIALPEPGYETRAYHPNCGSWDFSYYDYATPIEENIKKQLIERHRLVKKNPEEAISEAVEPIIYYLDNGTPEPVRSALLEGGAWWNQAFESIGYKDAFQIKILPDDADPLDVRYNVIQWVHRSTRGWSYGASITDPRTGEIIKGHVSLGSLRIRHDYMIAKAISNKPYASTNNKEQEMLNMAVARIRQLSAHEIGHTLGFQHNFAASVNDKASVMDYPHPTFELHGDEITYNTAYATGIGEWDKIATAFAYGTGSHSERVSNLNKALKDGFKNMSDSDVIPGGVSSTGHRWDNGADATAELERILTVRQVAMHQFSIDNIDEGEAINTLEDLFVPIYFMHRYQIEAAVKSVAGMDYHRATKGDGGKAASILPKSQQLSALNVILKSISPKELAIPITQLPLFPPRPSATKSNENFKGTTGIAFDAISATTMNVSHTLKLLLHPQRVSRLYQQHVLDNEQLGLEETLDTILANSIYTAMHEDSYYQSIQQNKSYIILDLLMGLSQSDKILPQVKSIIDHKLKEVQNQLAKTKNKSVFSLAIQERIANYFEHPNAIKPYKIPDIPMGSPIGSYCDTF
ncbi:zinc-dependent metalloprotease [Algibacter mikhailovii]|uniref:zinc-dependent metalloprotease n=1 Tax=Algibacter mikhailovii TaxID=425498 RepID=UPI0024947601|nr:zinc-dependent metalloprotease [Algibacter mikhailovii]